MRTDEIVRVLLRQRLRLLGYLRAIVGEHHLAEDAYQEVAAEAVLKAGQIKDEAHCVSWLMQAARFRGLDLVRRRGAVPALVDATLLDELEGHADALEADGDRLGALRACLDLLGPAARAVVDARYRADLVGEGLATALGRAHNTVYVALSRAHRQLADCVRQRLAQEGLRG